MNLSIRIKKQLAGFTLIEVMVVIVIIALLITITLSIQGLIRSSQIVSVISNIEDFSSNINFFEDTYKSLPGDMEDAQSYWTACVDDVADGNNCNGDGDGVIEWVGRESYRVWQHMVLANLIDGEYTGVKSTSCTYYKTKENMPSTIVAWSWGVGGYTIEDASIYSNAGNAILVGKATCNNTAPKGDNGLFTASEALAIDKKLDDGIADSGVVVSKNGNGATSGCVVNAGVDDSYDIGKDEKKCIVYFFFGGQ